MARALTLDARVPGDLTRTALGICLATADIETVLRPGLRLVEQMMATLGPAVKESLAEIDSIANPGYGSDQRVIKINRRVSLSHLAQRRLVVLDCDSGKVLALVCAVTMINTPQSRELLLVFLDAFLKGGIPVKVEGPEAGGSIFIRLFDQAVEIRPQKSA